MCRHHTLGPGRSRAGCEEGERSPGCSAGASAGPAGRAAGNAGRASAIAGSSGNEIGSAGSVAPGAGRGGAGRDGVTGAPATGSSTGGDLCAVPSSDARIGLGSNGSELDPLLFFSPLYSGYDGVHSFQVPITVRGYLGIEWETDRPDLVELREVNDNTAMITTRGAGAARIIAHAGPISGLGHPDDHALRARGVGHR